MTPEEGTEKYPDESPGSIRLAEIVMRVTRDAIERGLLDVDPAPPLDYRRVLCLTDGSRVDIRVTRRLRCACGRMHALEDPAPCASSSPAEAT